MSKENAERRLASARRAERRRNATPNPLDSGHKRGKKPGARGNTKYDPETNTRGGFAVCGFERDNGTICKNHAGRWTDHTGYGRCARHGGNLPHEVAKAHEARARDELAVRKNHARQAGQISDTLEIDPANALLWMVHMTAGAVQFLRGQLEDLPEEEWDSARGRRIYSMYSQERERLTKASSAAVRNGVSEVTVKLSEAQGAAQVVALRRASVAAELSGEQITALLGSYTDEMGKLQGLAYAEITTLNDRERESLGGRLPGRGELGTSEFGGLDGEIEDEED